jgi:hypothetical protein
MLSSVGRVAVQRLASRSAATSSQWLVASRPAISVACRQPTISVTARSYASATETKKAPLKKSTSTAKKPAAKKAAPKKKVAKKPAAKPKKVGRKPDSATTIKLKERAERKDLKEKALLNGPETKPATAWQLYVTESAKGKSRSAQETADAMKDIAVAYKSLPSAERQVRILLSLCYSNSKILIDQT